tara:strand:+ start:19251 stop:20207 length:957 start_codon:yes stop_codon:yes gene_type:complete
MAATDVTLVDAIQAGWVSDVKSDYDADWESVPIPKYYDVNVDDFSQIVYTDPDITPIHERKAISPKSLIRISYDRSPYDRLLSNDHREAPHKVYRLLQAFGIRPDTIYGKSGNPKNVGTTVHLCVPFVHVTNGTSYEGNLQFTSTILNDGKFVCACEFDICYDGENFEFVNSIEMPFREYAYTALMLSGNFNIKGYEVSDVNGNPITLSDTETRYIRCLYNMPRLFYTYTNLNTDYHSIRDFISFCIEECVDTQYTPLFSTIANMTSYVSSAVNERGIKTTKREVDKVVTELYYFQPYPENELEEELNDEILAMTQYA